MSYKLELYITATGNGRHPASRHLVDTPCLCIINSLESGTIDPWNDTMSLMMSVKCVVVGEVCESFGSQFSTYKPLQSARQGQGR